MERDDRSINIEEVFPIDEELSEEEFAERLDSNSSGRSDGRSDMRRNAEEFPDLYGDQNAFDNIGTPFTHRQVDN